MDPFYDFTIQCLNSGWSKGEIVKEIYKKGYSGSTSNALEHLCKIEEAMHKQMPYEAVVEPTFLIQEIKIQTSLERGKEKTMT